ncbi:hypothetical protein MKW98_016997 [Papaver atlanticum]|uniref:Xylanase inhibitor N-terminal domain-containing protein n=1 Tax=Papaver atlanticum TaxID=357466 RepID=A0AAD4TK65_9MAGN|nr:hypothetical protein MKW98_016997 [Papaver atlanticum]
MGKRTGLELRSMGVSYLFSQEQKTKKIQLLRRWICHELKNKGRMKFLKLKWSELDVWLGQMKIQNVMLFQSIFKIKEMNFQNQSLEVSGVSFASYWSSPASDGTGESAMYRFGFHQLHTLQLQSWEKTTDFHSPGQGLMPASFKAAIGRVAPVDSLLYEIELQFFDSGSSSSASPISCTDSVCSSVVQTAGPGCSENSQCSYQFKYLDGTGTAGFYVSDMLDFGTVTVCTDILTGGKNKRLKVKGPVRMPTKTLHITTGSFQRQRTLRY